MKNRLTKASNFDHRISPNDREKYSSVHGYEILMGIISKHARLKTDLINSTDPSLAGMHRYQESHLETNYRLFEDVFLRNIFMVSIEVMVSMAYCTL